LSRGHDFIIELKGLPSYQPCFGCPSTILSTNSYDATALGPAPAGASRLAPSLLGSTTKAGMIPPEPTTLEAATPLFHVALIQLTQYNKLCNLCQNYLPVEERLIALTCLRMIHKNIGLLYQQIVFKFKLHPTASTPAQLYTQERELLMRLQTQLWRQLSFPQSTDVRCLTFNMLLSLELLLQLTREKHIIPKFLKPISVSHPSIKEQIITRPLTIIDPYITALQQNYYFPLAQEHLTMLDELGNMM
jgi:hypothetical protein